MNYLLTYHETNEIVCVIKKDQEFENNIARAVGDHECYPTIAVSLSEENKNYIIPVTISLQEEDHTTIDVDGHLTPIEVYNGKQFPNGFDSWQETHFEVCQSIALEIAKDNPTGLVLERHEAEGHGGLYELAKELTNEFETIHEGREWHGEFFDEVEEFINDRIYPRKEANNG